jgi:hypothetical protein
MHGGKNPGAPFGNQNALKHGRYRQAVLREWREIRDFVRWCDRVLDDLALTAK